LGAARHFERSLNYRLFERGKKISQVVRLRHHLGELFGRGRGIVSVTYHPVCGSCPWYREGFQGYFLFGGEDTGPFNQVTKFPYISRKFISEQGPRRIGRDFTHGRALRSCAICFRKRAQSSGMSSR